jgi:hypothetical protein
LRSADEAGISAKQQARKEFCMTPILTKVSFPFGFAGMVDYLREQFASLRADQVAAVVALPKGAPICTMAGGRLTLITTDNFEQAISEVESNFREFAGAAVPKERTYIAFAVLHGTCVQELKDGREPRSHDGRIIANLMRAA